MVAVTPATRSPFSASGTESGSSSHGLAQLSRRTSIGTSVTSGPGTRADARATAAARSPARRASASGRVRHRHEAPRRPDQGPYADADRLALRQVLDVAVAGGHRLVALVHGAGVGIPGAGRQRGLDRRLRHLEHG